MSTYITEFIYKCLFESNKHVYITQKLQYIVHSIQNTQMVDVSSEIWMKMIYTMHNNYEIHLTHTEGMCLSKTSSIKNMIIHVTNWRSIMQNYLFTIGR